MMDKAEIEARPYAWVIPGDDNEDMNGFIDARITEEGEFTNPLYDETALTALRAERDAAEERAEKAEAQREKDHAEINIKADFIEKTINQLAAAQEERDALIEICQEVSFFLKLFSAGKPVYADRLQSALDKARAALPADLAALRAAQE